jgi:hypothetical protein
VASQLEVYKKHRLHPYWLKKLEEIGSSGKGNLQMIKKLHIFY